MNVAIVTDSNSGIFEEEGKILGVHVIPMPVILEGKTYYEGIDLTHEEFYQCLEEKREVFSSQPSPAEVLDMWDKLLLSEYDELVYIPMSSGLSGSCQTAQVLAQDYEEKVQVVGPKGTLKMSVLGPVRKETQIEVSLTDARSLGVAAPIRESGDIAGSGSCTLI